LVTVLIHSVDTRFHFVEEEDAEKLDADEAVANEEDKLEKSETELEAGEASWETEEGSEISSSGRRCKRDRGE
jgi:hypothetical protein